jgi:pyruvate kinase
MTRFRRKARIVCTIGPACAKEDVLFKMIARGMDVARLNFSHGDHAFHRKVVGTLRKGAGKYGRPLSILQDLQGIKIRVGPLRGGSAELRRGKEVRILAGDGLGDGGHLYVSYPKLLQDAKRGEKVLLDDGFMQLRVTGKTDGSLTARVVEGGLIRDRKGVNFPGMKLSLESFTPKDRTDLELGLRMNVDYIAVSFVRSAADITKVKNWMKRRGKTIPVIAKIEKAEALEDIDNILDVSDGVMIARGDLGVEMAPEKVPLIQKGLIAKANGTGKLVITATQMLESMREHLRPTRAEASDVANAVIDGTDALMLSAETAIGRYPLEAIAMMDKIIRHTEQWQEPAVSHIRGTSDAGALADAACRAAEDIGASVLAVYTRSGFTARLLSKFRPKAPIVAYTPDRRVLTGLPLYWGVIPKYMRSPATTDELCKRVEKMLTAEKIVRPNDRIVIIASSPFSTASRTNFMKIHRIGE